MNSGPNWTDRLSFLHISGLRINNYAKIFLSIKFKFYKIFIIQNLGEIYKKWIFFLQQRFKTERLLREKQ